MYNKIVTKNNKVIHVFDDTIELSKKLNIYKFVKNSFYKIAGHDGPIIEKFDLTIVSNYSEDDLNTIDFKKLPDDVNSVIDLKKHKILNSTINLCKPDDIFHVHTDSHFENYWTLIYYVNTSWDVEWGGDTVFLDESNKIEYVSQYTPGRIVIFDSTIPHLIRPSTRLAPDYRFTLAIKYIK